MRTVLLNPGPVTLSERVRAALLRPDLCHREKEFATLQDGLREKLLQVYGLDNSIWAAVLLTGSGTAAVEAMLLSYVPADGAVLVLENGVYGERIRRILTSAGIDHYSLSSAWGEAIDLTAVADALAEHRYTQVAVVHHETTTGRLNDLSALARVCADHKVRMLVDGVSSFAAEAIDFDGWPLDACAATANKCLHGVPGTAFVVGRRDALQAGAGETRSVYLNLSAYLTAQDQHGTPFTQSVQTFYALDEALDEFHQQGGWQQRQACFRQRMARIGETLAGLGVKTLLGAAESSCVLNAFVLPDGHTYSELHDALKARGFIIYAGQGALSESVFRISAMGDITADDLDRLCAEFTDLLG